MQNRSLITMVLLLILSMVMPGYAAESAQVLRIERLAIDPSAILSDDEIVLVKAKYEGAEIALDRLHQITDEIDALYAAKGYIAKAMLPPQTIENGVLTISLVEGRVGEVHIEGNRYTKDTFFMDRLSLGAGDLIQVDTMEHDITYFNRTNDVTARVELMPGQAFGTTDVALFVGEPKNNQYILALDNAGRKETGRYRTSFTWQNMSITGYRDPLTLTVLYVPGTEVGSLTYNFPVTRWGSRLGASYSANSVEFREGTYAPVGLKVHSQNASLSLSYPLHVAPEMTVLASFEWHHRESKTYLSGSQLTGSRGRSGVVALTIESQTPTGMWTLNQGIRGGKAQAPAFTGDSYYKYNVSFQQTVSTPNGATWLYRGALQYTLDASLPPDEQFSLGGGTSVRGHMEGAVSGDRGYTLTVEYHRPIHERIRANVFLDHGGVVPFKGNDEPQSAEEYLTSIGLGAEIQVFKGTTAHLHYGVPLGAGVPSSQVQFRVQSVF